MSLGGFLLIARHVQKHVGADALYFHGSVRLDFYQRMLHSLFFSEKRSITCGAPASLAALMSGNAIARYSNAETISIGFFLSEFLPGV